MGFIFGSVIFMAIAILLIVLLMPRAMEKGMGINKKSDKVIHAFEMDNAVPELSEMIQYHRDNGTVEYEV